MPPDSPPAATQITDDRACSRRYVALLLLILALAAAVRLYAIGRASLSTDELFSLWDSTGRGLDCLPHDVLLEKPPNLTEYDDAPPWWDVFAAMKLETHPPLYFVLLRFWRETFGAGDAVTRLFSVTTSLAAVALLFDVVRLLHNAEAGLWAALIMALASPQIEYAQEARGYAMLTALTLACCAMIARINLRGATVSRCIALGLLLLISMLTHYYAAPPLAAVALAAVALMRGRQRTRVIITVFIAAALFLVVWGPMFWRQRPNFTNNMQWSLDTPGQSLRATAQRVLELPIRYLFEPRPRTLPLGRVAAIVYLLPLLLVRRQRWLLLWWLMLLLVVGAVAASDLRRGAMTLSEVRYTLPAAAAVYVICVLTGLRLRGWQRQIVPATLVLGCALALANAYTRWKLDFRSLANYAARNVGFDDTLIVLTNPENFHGSDILYAAATHYSGHAPGRLVMLTHPPNDELMRRLRSSTSDIWVLRGPGESIESFLPGASGVDTNGDPYIGTVSRIVFNDDRSSNSSATRP